MRSVSSNAAPVLLSVIETLTRCQEAPAEKSHIVLQEVRRLVVRHTDRRFSETEVRPDKLIPFKVNKTEAPAFLLLRSRVWRGSGGNPPPSVRPGQ